MSLILKGVDLPTNGETLIVGIYGNGNVSVEHSKPLVLPIEISADAIQIPKGHGRLIDGDELLHNLYSRYWYDHEKDLDEIRKALAILEAEAEK